MINLILSMAGVTVGVLAVFWGIEARRLHADLNPPCAGRI